MWRALAAVTATALSAAAVPLMPRVCDNYAPLVTCRDAPEVGLPGLEYAENRQAYGSVMQGHKPFPMDHQAMGVITQYSTMRLRKDIAKAKLPPLFRGKPLEPQFWGSRLCSARSLALRYTLDGTTPRTVLVGGGQEVPVFFGITLQLQFVSAWHPAPMTEEDAEHELLSQRAGWMLGLDPNSTSHGRSQQPWAPTLWLAHRMDVSYDPSRSFSVQRHTWRTVGGGGAHIDAAQLLDAALTKAGPPRMNGTGETTDPFDALGLPEALRGENETTVRVALALESLCDCAGAAATTAEADAAKGAGGTLFTPGDVVSVAGGSAQDEEGCASEFLRSSDGDGRTPVEEVDAAADAAAAANSTGEAGAAEDGTTAPGDAPPSPVAPRPRRLKARSHDLLSLRPECAASYAVSREPAALLAGTGCPFPAAAVGWVERSFRKPEPASPEQRAADMINGVARHARPKTPPAILREALRHEASTLTGMVNDPQLRRVETEVRPDGETELGTPPLEIPCDASARESRCEPMMRGGGRLRVASFNAWNSNPPAWLYPDPHKRWARYRRRMDLFASLLRGPAPAIVGLQEVRLDITLGPRNEHGQMLHLAERLPGYQYVAQPATVYASDGSMLQTRDEEGVAILSAYPVVASDYAVLSRDPEDPRDEHARVCLHAVVATDDPAIGLVDVYSVHMPLSDAARNRTTVEVDRFIAASRLGSVQILLGDMNDEPHNATMRFWAGDTPLRVANATGSPYTAGTPLTDAWLQAHDEPEPRSADPAVRRSDLTFPSDDPKKRIDTAFVASAPPSEPGLPDHRADRRNCTIAVADAWLIGQDPAPGTGPDPDATPDPDAEHVGMVHGASPLWASDHRGVVFDLIVGRNP